LVRLNLGLQNLFTQFMPSYCNRILPTPKKYSNLDLGT